MLLNINTPLKTYRHLTDILVYYTKVIINIKQIDLYAVSTFICSATVMLIKATD